MVSELPWLWSVALDLEDGSLSVGVTRLGGVLSEMVMQGSLALKGTVMSKGHG